MSKRANGEGAIYQTASGRWIGEIVQNGKRRRVSGSEQRVVAAKLRDMISQHRDTGVAIDGHASLSQLIAEWRRVELPSRECAETTRTRFELHCAVLDEHLGAVRLRTLGAERIETMYDELVKGSNGRRPWGRASLIGLRSALGQILTFGMRRGWLTRNVAPITVIPAKAKREQRRSSLSVEQAHTLFAACAEHERLGAMWRVAMLTGLRPGEVAGLTWKGLTLGDHSSFVTVSRNVVLDKRGCPQLIDGVKTEGSYRTIGLAPQLVPVLTAHRAAQRAQRVAASSWATHDLVFCTSGGEPLNPANVRRDLAKFCREIELPEITPNELRHTAASLLLDAGMTSEQVAKLLGHKSTRMLERHYRHTLRPLVSDHVDVMGAIFGGAS
jgi:integrase